MDQESMDKFVEVTGESEATARHYLSLADGNVENAITLMFEGGPTPESSAQPVHPEPEPEVRPPILPVQEVLVPSGPICSLPRLSTNVFDRFRDFAVETQRQEEEMARKVAGVKNKQMSYCKSKRLEDLFRPPCNILFLGSFIEAREHAKKLNRWLLVNIQNPQEFSCQILNRDVWSNQQIQEIVKDHFVLWQVWCNYKVLSNTSDGSSFIHLYEVYEYPHLAVIDPRTGECMQTYNHITVDSLMSVLNDMLSSHPSPECVTSNSSDAKKWKSSTATIIKESSSSDLSDCSGSAVKAFKHTIDSSMVKDLDSNNDATTVQRSTTSMPVNAFQNIIKKRRMNEFDEMKERNERKEQQTCQSKFDSHKDKTDTASGVRVCLRLPNGTKETMLMSAMDTIQDLIDKLENMGYLSSDHTYLVPFPKTNIGELPPQTHLSDTILFPANTVFITKIY